MTDLAERTAGVKARLQIPHTAYSERWPEQRILDFDEIVLGYDAETARREASRCLQCPAPAACTQACPLHNDIPLAMPGWWRAGRCPSARP
jgi:glutamate synthase (NADPH/NADH) small chain